MKQVVFKSTKQKLGPEFAECSLQVLLWRVECKCVEQVSNSKNTSFGYFVRNSSDPRTLQFRGNFV